MENSYKDSSKKTQMVRKLVQPGLRLLRVLRGHTRPIGRFAWSPSGQYIASPSFDRTIRIWKVSNGELIKELTGNTERVVTVAWAPDEKRLISAAGAASIRIWDIDEANKPQKLQRIHSRAIVSLDWSPDGNYFISGGWDGVLGIWDANTGKLIKQINHNGSVICVAWSHTGDTFAVAGSGSVAPTIWKSHTWENITPGWMGNEKRGSTYGLSWSVNDMQLYCASEDRAIVFYDLTNKKVSIIEGHTGLVKAVSCSFDGRFFASKGGLNDNRVMIWRSDTSSPLTSFHEASTHSWRPSIAFHPNALTLATLGDRESSIYLWELDADILLDNQLNRTISYTSAKIALVGESNVGKSYLAHRIVTGLPPVQGSIKSTHGMKFWPIELNSPTISESSTLIGPTHKNHLEILFNNGINAKNQRRDIVLWDMGGQEEYRLIHQLFLHDTTVALILFDPTRGTTAFNEVEVWVKSLEKQLRGRTAVKILVGSKIDQQSLTIFNGAIEQLCKECGFTCYHETSSITGRGIDSLCADIAKAIDWEALGKSNRPALFQEIRDEIESKRKQGEVVLKIKDLYAAVTPKNLTNVLKSIAEIIKIKWQSNNVNDAIEILVLAPNSNEHLGLTELQSGTRIARPELFQSIFDEIEARVQNGDTSIKLDEIYAATIRRDIDVVSTQLASQGIIARSKVSTGEPVLVLQVQEIERYAGSLIIAAKNNPRGVPALELNSIANEDFLLPGIEKNERLPREQEKPVIECTVQLMLEHGICFQHEGLLIFPTLFSPLLDQPIGKTSHGISLFYDFAGAIDNIYASLIAWLVLAKEFGKVRLWSDRAEFEVKDGGVCGLIKKIRPGGFAHVDVYFESDTAEPRRQEFISFVEDHLAENGVEIHEHVTIKCVCGHEFAEETLRQRIARGDRNVLCPVCETRHNLTEGVATAREKNPKISQHTWALRTRIEKLRERMTKQAVQVLVKAEDTPKNVGPIRLLHLSDLHFTADTPVKARLQWLLDDLKQTSGLGCKELDYLVISGDFTDKGCTEGFEKAYEFVSDLTAEFGLSAQRCIFVPGNHDIVDRLDCYTRCKNSAGLKSGEWFQEGKLIMARSSEKYPLRFTPFSDYFYHKFVQLQYPIEYIEQGFAIPFWDTGIQFLTLNSCWQIDEFHRKRSGVHVEAVANAVKQAQKQEDEARKSGQLVAGKPILRIAVWHHAVAGPEQMKDTGFLGNLQKHGVSLALHGDVHQERRDLIGYWTKEKLYVLGSGSFGARAEDRPEASPRLYNFLEISRDLKSAKVHTRCQPRSDDPWRGWNEWPRSDGSDGAVPYYNISW